MFDIDWDALSFDDYALLREELIRQMRQRFERQLALVFTDVVGSTAYTERHGSVAGEALLRRHEALVKQAMQGNKGWIVDFAGDGAFCVFEVVGDALRTLVDLQSRIVQDNVQVAVAHHLSVRSGLHWGPALVSKTKVRGETVNTAARVASSASGGEIRVSPSAFEVLDPDQRVRCQPLSALSLKGIAESIELLTYDWRDPALFPTRVTIEQTGEEVLLPCQDRITFGRLRFHAGERANDIVLKLDDDARTRSISRWHIALEHSPSGFRLRSLSSALTVVDEEVIQKGKTAAIRLGSRVGLSDVITLRFGAETVDPDLSRTIDPSE